MAKQTIITGNSANDGSGDPARSAFTKINNNFTEIYQYIGDGSNLNKLGSAAFKNVGTSAGNVMEVGAFGLGGDSETYVGGANGFEDYHKSKSGFFFSNTSNVKVGNDQLPVYTNYIVSSLNSGGFFSIGTSVMSNEFYVINGAVGNAGYPLRKYNLRHSGNTTVDANGFIKAASPIVQLFAEKIELNGEAAEQDITFEKINIGHYLVKGSSGFAQKGWYIETPKDANGNILFAVNYEQLENGDIEVKTYKKKFDLESTSIVADLENPVDITLNRWIDIRLQEVPKLVPEIPTEEVNSDEPQQ